MRGIGALPRLGSVDVFGAFLAAEQARWKIVVERTGVRAERRCLQRAVSVVIYGACSAPAVFAQIEEMIR
jgi:hypothetical protein